MESSLKLCKYIRSIKYLQNMDSVSSVRTDNNTYRNIFMMRHTMERKKILEKTCNL